MMVMAEASNPILNGKKVLSVEDDVFLSGLLAKKLISQGCKLFYAANGEDALAIVGKETLDIILLDVLLPGMDGFEILKNLKTNPKTKDIPVVLLSNLGQKSDIEKGEKLGASKFLVKATVTLDEIIDEVSKVVGK
jgi:CheY-like chemotaxis protein